MPGKETDRRKVHKNSGSGRAASSAGRGEAGHRETERAERNRARKLKVLKIRLIAAAAVAVALVFWYCMAAASYRGTFLPHTTLNGLDVSGLTAEEAEQVLKTSVEDYSLTITFRGGSTETVSKDDIDLTYVPSGEVEELVRSQKRLTWLPRFFGKKADLTAATGFRFDENALQTALAAMPEYANGTEPVDAKITLGSDGLFEIEPEAEGSAVDSSAAFRRIVAAVNTGTRQLNLDSYNDTYKTPQVRSDDETLTKHLEELNAFTQRTFTVKCKDGQTETVGPEVLASWVTHSTESDTWTIDEDDVYSSCYAFVQKIADRDDDIHTTVDFATTSLGTVTEPCRDYGYEIDVGDGAMALYTAMENNSSDPVEMVNSISEEPRDTTDTYVEVDVTNQVLYFYKGGKLFFRTKIVTGLESDPERRTPSGVFHVQGKDEDRVLGSLTAVDPGARYESHVDYWMPFYESYGMHDASWRDDDAFGGDVYLAHGSHGCVNLPPSSAKIIYNNIETLTTVVVVRAGDQADADTKLGDTKWNPPEGGLHYTEYEEDPSGE